MTTIEYNIHKLQDKYYAVVHLNGKKIADFSRNTYDECRLQIAHITQSKILQHEKGS